MSETLIMLWINGEEIQDQMVRLHQNGVRTYTELLEDEEAISTIQRIGVELGLDLGETGENGDGIDGNYGEKTRDAWRQVQQALVEAGYNLGEFGENNDGVDGAVGEVTMNILMNAAQSTAPGDEVVEDAIAQAADPDREGAATERQTQFDAIRGDAEDGAEISAEHLNEYATNLTQGFEGVQYDGENQEFTHILTDEPLPVGEVISGTYGEVDRSAMNDVVDAFDTAQISSFAGAEGVEVTDVEGVSSFEYEERTIPVQDILSEQRPLEAFAEWKASEAEVSDEDGEFLNADKRTEISTILPQIAGVEADTINFEAGTVALFNGETVKLTEANLDGTSVTPERSYPALRHQIQQAAEATIEGSPFSFEPGGEDQRAEPSHFTNAEGQIMFTLEELTAGEIDEDMPYTENLSPDRSANLAAFISRVLNEG